MERSVRGRERNEKTGEMGRLSRIPNDCFFREVERCLRAGLPVRFRVKGTSMTPLLRDGKEEVIVYPYGTAVPKRWDVVLFRYRGNYVLHRIIGCSEGKYKMQGDGAWASYEVCSRYEVLGVVREVISPSGYRLSTASRVWRWKSIAWRRLGYIRRFVLKWIRRQQAFHS